MPKPKKKIKVVKKPAVRKPVRKLVKRVVKKRVAKKVKPSIRFVINKLMETVNALIVRVVALENTKNAEEAA